MEQKRTVILDSYTAQIMAAQVLEEDFSKALRRLILSNAPWLLGTRDQPYFLPKELAVKLLRHADSLGTMPEKILERLLQAFLEPENEKAPA